MNEVPKKRIDRKTAILGAIVLILSQQLITQWTIRAASSPEVISYISFAGTLISILLAVLAIVYSYFATASQKSDADRIATQIGMLTQSVSSITASGARLSGELVRLEEIRDKLDDMGGTVSKIKEKADEIGKHTEDIASREIAQKIAATSADDADEESERKHVDFVIKTIAQDAIDSQCIFYYAAIKRIIDELSFSKAIELYVTPFRTSPNSATDLGEVYAYSMIFIDLNIHKDGENARKFAGHLADRFEQPIEGGADDSFDWDLIRKALKDYAIQLREFANQP